MDYPEFDLWFGLKPSHLCVLILVIFMSIFLLVGGVYLKDFKKDMMNRRMTTRKQHTEYLEMD